MSPRFFKTILHSELKSRTNEKNKLLKNALIKGQVTGIRMTLKPNTYATNLGLGNHFEFFNNHFVANKHPTKKTNDIFYDDNFISEKIKQHRHKMS